MILAKLTEGNFQITRIWDDDHRLTADLACMRCHRQFIVRMVDVQGDSARLTHECKKWWWFQ